MRPQPWLDFASTSTIHIIFKKNKKETKPKKPTTKQNQTKHTHKQEKREFIKWKKKEKKIAFFQAYSEPVTSCLNQYEWSLSAISQAAMWVFLHSGETQTFRNCN